MNPFQDTVSTGTSTKADEKLINVLENTYLKLKFSHNNLFQFWPSVQHYMKLDFRQW